MEVAVCMLDQQLMSTQVHCGPPSPSSMSDKDSAEAEDFYDDTNNHVADTAEPASPLSPTGNAATSDEEDGSLSRNPALYNLQAQAPTPKCVVCDDKLLNSSTSFGPGYHGQMNEEAVTCLLQNKEDGSYLIWHDLNGQHTLSLVYAQKPVSFTLLQHEDSFFCGDKVFKGVTEMVQDQLIQMFFQACHATMAVAEGQLQRRRTLQKLQRRPCRRLKGSSRPKGLDQSQRSSSEDLSNTGLETSNPTSKQRGTQPAARESPTFPSNERHYRSLNKTNPHRRSAPDTKLLSTMSLDDLGDTKVEVLKKSLTVDQTREPNRRFRRAVSDDLASFEKQAAPSLYHKCHKFEVNSYKGPHWCDMCGHFLWGLSQQGMKCQLCGINIHKQCYSLAMEVECVPTKKMIKQVFGIDLTTIAKMDGSEVPKIVKQCIQVIEERGLSDEGIYRVSGNSCSVMEIKEKFNEGEKVDFSQYADINIMTGALKLFLRELPVPVVSFDAYNEIMRATSMIDDIDDPKTDWKILANALKFLPKAHYHLLKCISQHLFKVVQHSSQNKMTPHNLAVVFAPTLMRAPSDNLSLVKDFGLQKHFVQCVVTKHAILFE